MRKIKKIDPKTSQTVFSFGCACGSCLTGCHCKELGIALTSWRISFHQSNNRSNGGSLVGGAGRSL